MFEVKPMTINVNVNFGALDRLVDYLSAKNEELKAAAATVSVEEVKPERKKRVAKAEEPKTEAPKDEPVAEVNEEPKVIDTAKPGTEDTEIAEPVVVEEAPKRVFAPEEVSAMAIKLRDKDRANSAKIKEYFPEIGIKSLGDIRSNNEACQKLGAILVDMGGEA